MVYVTGDCHADFHKFSTKQFPDQKEMTKDDIVIVCGDFGIWNDDPEERHWLKWLDEKPFTTVFVDGNHENFDRLYSDEFQTIDFHGGKAQRIRNSIYHLLRGEVYEFEGKTFWCFGGASSHDISDGIIDADDFETYNEFYAAICQAYAFNKMCRINHVSWWKQELPSEEEMEHGRQTLAAHGNKVDYIITHCCAQEIATACGFREPDILTSYFNEIAHTAQFDRWYFGHYHGEAVIWGKFILHYDDIERIL